MDIDQIPKAIELHKEHAFHRAPKSLSDKIAYTLMHTLARVADFFFKKRYGHRAIVLETVAGVPGMVAGMLLHLKSLRLIKDDHGWIKTLLDEAENERMHLMVYSRIYNPTWYERVGIIIIQFFFFVIYLLLYILSAKTAHRTVGYLEEEATHSYKIFLEMIDNGTIHNRKAPKIAIDYWGLSEDATLRDVVIATQKDEEVHRDINHGYADILEKKH